MILISVEYPALFHSFDSEHFNKNRFYSGWFLVFNTAFNNISVISWHSLLLVQETEVLGENH
jgi:hypothetical protein